MDKRADAYVKALSYTKKVQPTVTNYFNNKKWGNLSKIKVSHTFN
jgi:hypothetical protein